MTCPEGRRFRRAPLPPIAKLTAATTTKKKRPSLTVRRPFLVFFSSRFMFVIFFLDGSRLVFFKLINHRRTVCFSFVFVCVCVLFGASFIPPFSLSPFFYLFSFFFHVGHFLAVSFALWWVLLGFTELFWGHLGPQHLFVPMQSGYCNNDQRMVAIFYINSFYSVFQF